MGEFLRAFAMIIGALVIIYFSTRFASYLGQAADGKIAPAHITQMLLLKMLVSMKDLVPMSLFLGIFAAIIRLQRDSELTAMRAAGAGPAVLVAAALKLSVLSALIVGAITLYAEPRAEGVLELVAEREGVEDTLGQRDAATVALWVAEMRALPERRSDAVALGEAEGVLDAGALRERVAQPVGLLLDVVEAVAVFDGGAVREPVAHDDAVRVVDMVRVPDGESVNTPACPAGADTPSSDAAPDDAGLLREWETNILPRLDSVAFDGDGTLTLGAAQLLAFETMARDGECLVVWPSDNQRGAQVRVLEIDYLDDTLMRFRGPEGAGEVVWPSICA
jgi:hypothetical protein